MTRSPSYSAASGDKSNGLRVSQPFAWEPLVNDYHILRQEEVYISTINFF